MELSDLLNSRRSTRAFTGRPVPREVLDGILSDAANAPSAMNLQPWEVHMVLGEELRRLSRRLLRSFRERGLSCGPQAARPIPQRVMDRGRQGALGMTPLIEAMGSDFKKYVNEGSLNFYGAPAAALIFLDESLHPSGLTDIGSFLAYLLLAAACHGLGSCPIGLVTSYEDDIKDHLNVAESKRLVVAAALGEPDPAAPINEFRSTRASLKEFVRWVD